MARTYKVPDGTRHFSDHGDMDDARVERLEELAFEFGRYYDSYIITEPNREYFWCREDRGVIGFYAAGRYLNISGGLIAADKDKPALLTDLIAFAEQNRIVLSFFSIAEDELPLFRKYGFQVTKFAEESTIPLGSRTWSGKKFEWVRRQSNYVRRQNVAIQELRESDYTPEDWETLLSEVLHVSAEHIATKPQKGEVPFFEGQLLPGYLYRRRLFVARSDGGQGRIEGFLVCNPMRNGESWAIEMYRQRVDAVRGTIPFMMHQVIQKMQEEGCKKASLCPVPTIRCEKKLPGDCFPARMGLIIWGKYFSSLFDIKGLYHFKSRFRPEFESVYICAYPRSSLGSTIGYVRCIGAARFKVWQVLKNLLTWKGHRRTLARPTPQIPATPQPEFGKPAGQRRPTAASAKPVKEASPAESAVEQR